MGETLVKNRKAFHEYHILERFEGGLELLGSEVKAIRAGKVHIHDAWIDIQDGEALLRQAHVVRLQNSSFQHDPDRVRKVLLHKREIHQLDEYLGERGMTLVVLSIYLKRGLIKIEIGVARGKKLHDKRASTKSKEAEREIAKALKQRR